MGTTDIFELAAGMKQAPDQNNQGSEVHSLFKHEAKHSPVQSGPEVIQAPLFTRVHITNPMGFSAHCILKSVSRGGIQVFSPIPIPTRCPLQVAILGCRPIDGEALYCMKRASVHRVGIVLSPRPRPTLAIGSVANVRSMEPPFAVGRGSILDVRASSVSVFGKVAIVAGSWVRIESSGWVLFGVVKDLVPTSMIGRYLEIHLEAAFPVDQSFQTVTETAAVSSEPEPPIFAISGGAPRKEEVEA